MNSSLYIHIPFCKRLCGYCDFFKSLSLDKSDVMLEALAREMEERTEYLKWHELRTIYIGGGTPSVYSPEQLQTLLDKAKELWDCTTVDEITSEANPDDMTDNYLANLAKTEINRLSVGIQSFNDRHLKFMNRRHNSKEAISAIQRAQKEGFNNISIDLIYGLPNMSLKEWSDNIKRAVDLGVQHISAYHLTLEPNSVFGRHKLRPIDEKISEEQYLLLHDMLLHEGFDHYEISNFALPDYRSKHNSAYWGKNRYLGIGPSAHSYDGERERSWAVASIDEYLNGVGTDAIYGREILTDKELFEEYVMVRLRTVDGVRIEELEKRFGEKVAQNFLKEAHPFIENNILYHYDGIVRFARGKWLISDAAICEFFDCM